MAIDTSTPTWRPGDIMAWRVFTKHGHPTLGGYVCRTSAEEAAKLEDGATVRYWPVPGQELPLHDLVREAD